MVKIQTTVKLEEDDWKEAKKKCIDKNLEISEYIGELIRRDVKK